MPLHDVAFFQEKPIFSENELPNILTDQVYHQNPFGLLAMPTTATEQELQRQLQRMKASVSAGDTVWQDEFYPCSDRNIDIKRCEDAFQKLRDPWQRFIWEFMWFWPAGKENNRPDPALISLSADNTDAAIMQWTKAEQYGSGRAIATHNLAVLYHWQALSLEWFEAECEELWRKSIEKWQQCFSHEATWHYLENRVRQLNDPRLNEKDIEDLRDSFTEAFFGINKKMALTAINEDEQEEAEFHMDLILSQSWDVEIGESIRRALLDAALQRVLEFNKKAKSQIDEDPEDALDEVDALIEQTEKCRDFLDSYDNLSDWDPAAEAHDAVAKEILHAARAYGNETGDLEAAREALEKALDIARDDELIEKLQRNISIVENIESSAKAMQLRSEAVDLANDHNDYQGALRKLNEALRITTDDEVVQKIKKDIQTVHGLIQQEQAEQQREIEEDRASRLEIMIGSTRVRITPEEISCGNKSIRTKDVIGISWGISKHYTNGVRDSRSFSVSVVSSSTSLDIECTNHFWESDAEVMVRYKQVIDKVWRTAGVRVLTELISSISRGEKVQIGPFSLEKRGIWIKKTKLLFFSGEPELVPWSNITWYGSNGQFVVESRGQSKLSGSMDYKNEYNAHILESFLDFIKDSNNFARMQKGEL